MVRERDHNALAGRLPRECRMGLPSHGEKLYVVENLSWPELAIASRAAGGVRDDV